MGTSPESSITKTFVPSWKSPLLHNFPDVVQRQWSNFITMYQNCAESSSHLTTTHDTGSVLSDLLNSDTCPTSYTSTVWWYPTGLTEFPPRFRVRHVHDWLEYVGTLPSVEPTVHRYGEGKTQKTRRPGQDGLWNVHHRGLLPLPRVIRSRCPTPLLVPSPSLVLFPPCYIF